MVVEQDGATICGLIEEAKMTWTECRLDMNRACRRNGRMSQCIGAILVVCSLVALATGVTAEDKPVEVRMVTLAPLGTSPHVSLLKMGEKWQKVSEGRVKLTVIASYRAGGEAAIVDKMGIGGVDAALVTVVGLSKVDKGINALGGIPMVYRSLEEVDHAVEKLGPDLANRLEQKGYVMLFWSDLGWVRHFSVEPLHHPEDFKRMKLFVWAGNPDQVGIMKDWGTNPVALEPADILSSLSTGMIDEVAATPFSANAGQFATITKHMLEVNWGPLLGGAIIRKQTWERIPAEYREDLLKIAAETGKEIRVTGRKESDDAVEVMRKKQGLQVYVPSSEVNEEWEQVARSVYPKIRGTMVPADMFDKVESVLREYRSKGEAGK